MTARLSEMSLCFLSQPTGDELEESHIHGSVIIHGSGSLLEESFSKNDSREGGLQPVGWGR
jgi:hypothetical protein